MARDVAEWEEEGVWSCDLQREIHLDGEGRWMTTVVEHGSRIVFEVCEPGRPEDRGRAADDAAGAGATGKADEADDSLLLSMTVTSDDDADYALLVDYRLQVATSSTLLHDVKIERELWRAGRAPRCLHRLPLPLLPSSSPGSPPSARLPPHVRVRFRLRLLQSLSPQDLRVETARRRFCLLSGNASFFVDPQAMGEWEGVICEQMREAIASGRDRLVVQQMTADMLETLLDAICTYRQLVVTRRNYAQLLWMCAELRMPKVVRAVESVLMDMRWMHPISKLELAVLNRCARLGDAALKQLGPPLSALEALHEWMALEERQMGGHRMQLDEVHPDVLQALNIRHDYAIIG